MAVMAATPDFLARSSRVQSRKARAARNWSGVITPRSVRESIFLGNITSFIICFYIFFVYDNLREFVCDCPLRLRDEFESITRRKRGPLVLQDQRASTQAKGGNNGPGSSCFIPIALR